MTTERDVEGLVSEIEGLPKSLGPARDAVTVREDRLHIAKDSTGRLELFIEGQRESFGRAALGRALEFGEYQELNDSRMFEALVIRASTADASARAMAHVAYEALRAVSADPNITNERLLALLGPYLGLAARGRSAVLQAAVGHG